MLDSVCEEHQVHGLRPVHSVEFLELRLAILLDEITFSQLTVDINKWLLAAIVIWVDHGCEGAEKQRLHLDKVVKVLLELSLGALFE